MHPTDWDTNQDAFKFTSSIKYVPTLVSLSIRILSQFPDQVYHLPSGFHLEYHPSPDPSQFDILRALIPTYSSESFSIQDVHPQLWATLAQLYPGSLPSSFSTYPLPFYDPHLPLIQSIPSTASCAFITVLELPGCKELNDATVSQLRSFHTLVAFDASDTPLSSLGVHRLVATCLWSTEHPGAPERRGPWGLRILRLRNCRGVDDAALKSISKLMMLSVVDLRGTSVTKNLMNLMGNLWGTTTPSRILYHPTPLMESLLVLENIASLSSSSFTYWVHIDRLSRTRHRENYLSSGGSNYPTRPSVGERSLQSLTESPSDESLGELDIMNKVAAAEVQKLVSKQQVLQFYASPSSGHRSTHNPPDRGYSAQSYYSSYREKPEWPSFDDSTQKRDELMLYRHPPSPDTLTSTAIPHVAKRDRVGEVKADLNVGHQKMAAACHQAELMAKRRRISGEVVNPVFGAGTVVSSSVDATLPGVKRLPGRNPFRRTDEGGVPARQDAIRATTSHSQQKATTSPSVTGISPLGRSSLHSDDSTPAHNSKPLKPISTIPVPLLPQEEQRKLKQAAVKEEALAKKKASRRSVPGSGDCQDLRQMLKRMGSTESMKAKNSAGSSVTGGRRTTASNKGNAR
ncbi:hypothetical protein PQX77_004590 [Marasmius sp. AFHP31]|nr:hypothetical protein PQX77_004590 [Marasmius sp. AFHP31]